MKKTETLADLGMSILAEEKPQRPILGRHEEGSFRPSRGLFAISIALAATLLTLLILGVNILLRNHGIFTYYDGRPLYLAGLERPDSPWELRH